MAQRLVVITGCNSGLGYSLALRCAAEGHAVVAGCLRPEEGGATELRDKGVHVQKMDVTRIEDVEKVAKYVGGLLEDSKLELQAVVNNAGVMVMGEFEWQTPKLIEHQVKVNLMGPFNVAAQFLPQLRNHKGRLVNIVSHCATVGLPFMSIYSGTKAGLLNWNDALRIEQAKYGVKIISFTPGSFFTDSNIMSHQGSHTKEMLAGMKEEVHKDYLNVVQQYLGQLPSPQAPKMLTDTILLDKMMEALFHPKPKTSYMHEPRRYAIYHLLFRWTPTWLRDSLVKRFVSFPKHPTLE